MTRARSTRSTARWIAAVAVLVIAAAIAAHANPWRYVRLVPVAEPGVFLTLLATGIVLLGVAAQLAARPRRLHNAVAAWLAGATVLFCGWPVAVAMMDPGYDRGAAAVVAVSPDERFEVVAVRYRPHGDTTGYSVDRYELRSRAGVLSRRADRMVAEIFRYDAGPAAGAVVAVRFTGPREVELRTADAGRWTTAFDPRTLVLTRTLTWNGTTGYDWTG